MRAYAKTGIGLFAAAMIAATGVGALAPAPAHADDGLYGHWEPRGAGVLRIGADEYELSQDGSLRMDLASIFRTHGYRSWYHGDALVVRVDHDAPDVEWIDGAYGMSIEHVRSKGVIYLTPHESTRTCDCAQCAPVVIVNPAPTVHVHAAPSYYNPASYNPIYYSPVYYNPIYHSRYSYRGPWYSDVAYYDHLYFTPRYTRPRSSLYIHSGLTFGSGALSVSIGSGTRFGSYWEPYWYSPWRSWHTGYFHSHYRWHDSRRKRSYAHRDYRDWDREWRDRREARRDYHDGDRRDWRDGDLHTHQPDPRSPQPDPAIERNPLRVAPSQLRRESAWAATDAPSAAPLTTARTTRETTSRGITSRETTRTSRETTRRAQPLRQAERSGPSAASRGASLQSAPSASSREATPRALPLPQPREVAPRQATSPLRSIQSPRSNQPRATQPGINETRATQPRVTQPRTTRATQIQRAPLRSTAPLRSAQPQRAAPLRGTQIQRAAPQRSVDPRPALLQRAPLRAAQPQRSAQPNRAAPAPAAEEPRSSRQTTRRAQRRE